MAAVAVGCRKALGGPCVCFLGQTGVENVVGTPFLEFYVGSF